MIGIKEILRLIAVMILTFCSMFICSTFINYLLDLSEMQHLINNSKIEFIYNAKISMAKTITASAGGMLGAITLLVLIYSVGRFINENSANMGVMKALGYSEWRSAMSFLKFGIAVLLSSALAYAMSAICYPLFYDPLMEHTVRFGFHIETILVVIVAPTLILSLVSTLYARFRLRKKPLDLINSSSKTKVPRLTKSILSKQSDKPFLKELKKNILFNNIALLIFVGFAALAFSTQIQMAISVTEYASNYAAPITLISLGLILGLVTLLISLSFVVGANKKYIALLKAYGYSENECSKAILSGYRIISYVGFMIGTAYKYLLMIILIDSFAGEANASVTFDFMGFFVTLGLFLMFFELIVLLYKKKISRIPLKEIMQS